jgi:ABC-type transporter Mla MlaB component
VSPPLPDKRLPSEDDLLSLDFTVPDAIPPAPVVQAVEPVRREAADAVGEAVALCASGQSDKAIAVLDAAVRSGTGLGAEPRVAWDMLFDLLQSAGRREVFESLALDYATCFEISPPAWKGRATALPPAAPRPVAGPATISLSGVLGANAKEPLGKLPDIAAKSTGIRLDLSKVVDADEDGCAALCDTVAVLRKARKAITLGGAAHLAGILAKKLVPGRRANEHVWLLLLELYQQSSQQEAFETAALDYAITFEVSPPSWNPEFRGD